MEVDVSLDVALRLDVLRNRLDLNLAEGAGALVVLGAGVRAGARLAPVLVPVAVGVHTDAARAGVRGARLAPHAVRRKGVDVAVGVEHGQNGELDRIDNARDVGVRAVLREKRSDEVDVHTRADPLARVDATVEPEPRLGARSLARYLDRRERAALVRRADVHKRREVGVLSNLLLQPGVDIVKRVVRREKVGVGLERAGHRRLDKLLNVVDDRRKLGVNLAQVALESSEGLRGNAHVDRLANKRRLLPEVKPEGREAPETADGARLLHRRRDNTDDLVVVVRNAGERGRRHSDGDECGRNGQHEEGAHLCCDGTRRWQRILSEKLSFAPCTLR
eukprot:Opistho-1_new@5361